MVIKRLFTATVQKKCCRGDTIVYDPPDRDFVIPDIKDRKEDFEYNLIIWKDKVEEQLEKLADKECRRKGTPRLCHFKVKNAKVTEEIIGIKVPQDVLDRIERLEGLIMDSNNTIVEYTEQIADILAKKEEERTVEDKEKLIRLDGYIRSENESIRKFESEIKRLKTQWNIE